MRGRGEKWAVLILAVVMLSGAALRFYRAGDQSLWTDEISSAVIAGSSLPEILSRNLSPDKADIAVEEPPMLYFLMHYSMELGDGELFLRLPSIVFGILGILAIFLSARELFGTRTAAAAAFLMSISLYHIIYSQEARGYSPHIFFSLLSLFFLWRALRGGGVKRWGAFAASTALNIYSHYSAFQVLTIEAVVAAVFIAAGLFRRHRTTRETASVAMGFGLSVLAAGLIAAPLLKNFMGVMDSRLGGETIPFELNPVYFANLLARYGAGKGLPFIVYNFFFAAGLWRALRRGKSLELAAALIWLLFPFLVLSHTGYKYFFHIRYVIFTFPVYIMLAANGIVWLFEALPVRRGEAAGPGLFPGAVYTVFVAALFAGLSIKPLELYYGAPARLTDWKGVARHIEENWSPGTIILAESAFVVRELSYYLRDANPAIEVRSVRGDAEKFREVVTRNPSVWYVDGNPVFDNMVKGLFIDRVSFGSPVYHELGRRWLIDWDSSWFPPSNIRRYFPSLYYNNLSVDANVSGNTGPGIAKAKDSVFLSWPALSWVSARCVNCGFEETKEGTGWDLFFKPTGEGEKRLDGEERVDGEWEEDAAWRFEVTLPVPAPVDLRRHNLIEVTFKVSGEPLSLRITAYCDFDSDGRIDAEVPMELERGKNVFDSEDGFVFFSEDLLKRASALYPKRAAYQVTGLKLSASKKGGPASRDQPLTIGLRSMEFFGRVDVPAEVLIPEDGLYRIRAVSAAPASIGKVRGIHVKDIIKENRGVHCSPECRIETAGRTLYAYLGRKGRGLEITVPVERPLDLSSFPLLEITYRIEDDSQFVGLSAALDWTFDGRPDGYLVLKGEPGKNIFDLPGGYKLLQISIPQEAQRRFPGGKVFALTGLKIIAGKKPEGPDKFYGFEFRDIELYGSGIKREAKRAVLSPRASGWTSTGQGFKHTVVEEGASTLVAGFIDLNRCGRSVAWLSKPMDISLERYGSFSMPIEVSDPERLRADLFFDLDRDGDGTPDFTLKRSYSPGGAVYADFREEIRDGKPGRLKKLRVGLVHEKKCGKRGDEDEVLLPEYRSLHWRLGPLKFEGGPRVPAPLEVRVDGRLYRLASNGLEGSPGVYKHESGWIRLERGLHKVSMDDGPDDGRALWIELLGEDGGAYAIDVLDGGV